MLIIPEFQTILSDAGLLFIPFPITAFTIKPARHTSIRIVPAIPATINFRLHVLCLSIMILSSLFSSRAPKEIKQKPFKAGAELPLPPRLFLSRYVRCINISYRYSYSSAYFLILDALDTFSTFPSEMTTSVGACIILYCFASSLFSSASMTSYST